jgi:RNA polymerase sigma factor (TIGR02999 family)
MSPDGAVTALLRRARNGDQGALEELLPVVYQELHRLARAALRRERPDHTLQPTALLNETFLRIFGSENPLFQDRAHFLGIFARVARQVLVDYARARQANKRGQFRVELSDRLASSPPRSSDLLDLDQALEELAREDPRLVALIEMRFFAGMTAQETAEGRGESVHVVRHDLRYAQARLRRILDRSSI